METNDSSLPQSFNYSRPRRFPRYPVNLKIMMLRKGMENMQMHGIATVFGEGGMSVYLPLELVVGGSIQIQVDLPYTTRKMRLPAVVRNRSGFRYGVEFSPMPLVDRQSIARSCSALSLMQ